MTTHRLLSWPGLVCALLLVSAGTAEATHFRYGHISWRSRPDIAPHAAEISLFASFRRSGYGSPVIGSVITETIGGTVLNFGDGSTLTGPFGGPLQFRVLAFDATQDWVYTIALNPADANAPIIHTYANAGPWTVEINSCCRISLLRNAPDGFYRVASTINFAADVTSAVSTVPPIVNCASGALCSFTVSAGDSDNDTLRWRLAATSENGGMSQPPGLAVNATTGQLTWATAGQPVGLWGVQVIIESRTVAGVLRSQVAVDFIINLGAAAPGGTPPRFDGNTQVCGVTFDLVVGKAFQFPVQASDPDAGNTVTLNAIGLPSGATMTPGLPAAGNPILSTFQWTPTVAQISTSVVIFTATDNTGRQTQCNAVLQVRGDRDGDGLPDDWETSGYTHDGVFVNLPARGANPDHKDIFIRVDYMAGLEPKAAALAKVVAAFAAVPNSLFAVPNPDGANGITLHLDVAAAPLAFQTNLGSSSGGVYDWTEFEALKDANFPRALRLAYHYALFANIGPTTPTGGVNSGISRGIPSNDFLVTLGTWPNDGSVDEQAGTFMHELGHNLGLGHGGPISLAVPAAQVNVNYKPNYLSVMNYSFQMSGLRKGVNFGTFDYSRFQLPQLVESNLAEAAGLNSVLANGYGTVYYCGGARTVVDVANGPIDWNCDGSITAGVNADINKGAGTTLASYNDWANISFTGGTIGAGVAIDQPLQTPIDSRTLEDSQLEPPVGPSRLTARLVGTTLRLAWNPLGQTGEFQYRIYRATGSGGFLGIATTSAAAFAQPLTSGTYEYYVTGINGFGVESAPSNVVTVVVP